MRVSFRVRKSGEKMLIVYERTILLNEEGNKRLLIENKLDKNDEDNYKIFCTIIDNEKEGYISFELTRKEVDELHSYLRRMMDRE